VSIFVLSSPLAQPSAQAETIQIGYSTDSAAISQLLNAGLPLNVPLVTCTASTGPVTCPDVAGPPFNIGVLGADSNTPGTTQLSEVNSAVVKIKNISGTAQNALVRISANNFTGPTGTGLTYLSNIEGKFFVPLANHRVSLNYRSCIDRSNNLSATPFSCIAPLGNDFYFVRNSGAFGGTRTSTITSPLASPYAITQSFLIFLIPGSEMNFSASTEVTVHSVPSVTNPSFEILPHAGLPEHGLPVHCGPGCSFSTADEGILGWTIAPGSNPFTGQFQPGERANNYTFLNFVPEGITTAYSNGGTISQKVGETVQEGKSSLIFRPQKRRCGHSQICCLSNRLRPHLMLAAMVDRA
jgi:hypothetical protein